MSKPLQKEGIDKAKILNIYSEIQQVFQKEMNNLKTLIDKFNVLLESDQSLILKASNRILKSLKIGFAPFQNQLQKNQAPFDEEDYGKIYNKIQYLFQDSEFPTQVIECMKEMQNSELESLEVDQKSVQFQEYYYFGQQYCSYYGYFLNQQPTGRGILLNPSFILDGYFIKGEFVFGQQIAFFDGTPRITKFNQQKVRKQQMNLMEILQIYIMITNITQGDPTFRNRLKKEKFHDVLYQINDRGDLRDKNAGYYEKDYYQGYMLDGVRHGIGRFYNQQKRVFGWGLWKGDLLKYGFLLKMEDNNRFIEKYGAIQDDLQQYLF